MVKSWVPVSPPPSVYPVEGWEPLRLPDRPPPAASASGEARGRAGPPLALPLTYRSPAPAPHRRPQVRPPQGGRGAGSLLTAPLPRDGLAAMAAAAVAGGGRPALPLPPSLPTHNHLRPGPGVAARVAELRGRAGGRGGCGGVGRRWLGARRLSLGGVSAGWLRLSPAPPPAHAQT